MEIHIEENRHDIPTQMITFTMFMIFHKGVFNDTDNYNNLKSTDHAPDGLKAKMTP